MSQYIAPLKERGIDVTLVTHLDERGFRTLYTPGSSLTKALTVLTGAVRELTDVLATARDSDVIWVQREASLIGPEYLERLLALTGRPIVLDVDDAIWLAAPSEGAANPKWSRVLRSSAKADRLLKLSCETIVGSSHLAEHANKHASRVTVIPTVVSRSEWTPALRPPQTPICIGWVGSHSTAPFLQQLTPVLRSLTLPFSLRVVGASVAIDGVEVRCEPFDLAREVDAVRAFDIGIAPMTGGQWTDGKCGFKQLQYMALGIPCVTSPWRGARDFIRAGDNALVATDAGEWSQALMRLLGDAALRKQLGDAGRALVEARYCAEVQVDALAAVLERAARLPT
jgi:hypothetical protein